ncbi:MAG: HDOD domain-containing protein [Gammaproteobacteria bacterium]|nr:MAG: HDOD domain-containing protein [Gammaproteobacteria bacterium]
MNMQSLQLHNSAAETVLNLMVAMRPVYAKNLEVAAFEPLLKSIDDDREISADDVQALSQVISETYGVIYQNNNQVSAPCFLRVSARMLGELELPSFPKDQYIFELIIDDCGLEEQMTALQKLASEGYRLAITLSTPDLQTIQPFLESIHVLKVDIREIGTVAVRDIVKQLQPFGLDLLAFNLGSQQEFLQCIDIGFKYFSGDILGKPKESKGKKLSHNKVVLFEVLAELQNPNATVGTIEQLAIKDVNLTYKLLKMVNSAALGLSRQIDSLSHAINILGMEQMRRWVSLFLLDGSDDKPQELMRNMLVRGRMCEVIAELKGRDMPVSYFMTGLLSQLDVLADIEMPELVKQIPLNSDIKTALVNRSGPMGEILNEVENYQDGKFEDLKGLLDMNYYEVCFRHSTAWAAQIQQNMAV